MNDFDYRTPLENPKPRFLGMTIPQLLLLGGLIIVQLIILVLALKYVVLAPPPEIIPTVTPLVIMQPSQPTPTATPIPDFTSALITSNDLPIGYVVAPDDPTSFDFNRAYPNFNIHPVRQFAFYGTKDDQYVIGWVFALTNPQERGQFSAFVRSPEVLFTSDNSSAGGAKPIEDSQIAGPFSVGEQSTGWMVPTEVNNIPENADFVLFKDENLGGIIKIRYKIGQAPGVSAWDIAQVLHNRLVEVQTNGPIPTPAVIKLADLSSVTLTGQELPPEFVPIAQEDIPINPIAQSEMITAGLQIAARYGFQYMLPNHEETVVGYTFSFPTSMVNSTMDSLLESDPVIMALLPPDGVQKIQNPPVNKSIGDRFVSYAFMETGQTSNQRIDVIAFRRGYVGVVLYHAHYLGMWMTTLEDPAIQMDIKIQTLAAP